MAQSNVAREPSMDEILASIRKIIESNEASGPGLPANDQGPSSDNAYRADRPYLDDDGHEDIHLTIEDDVFSGGFDEIDTYAQASASPVQAFAPQEARAPAMPQSHVPQSHVPQSHIPLSLADVAARVRAASERQSQTRPSEAPIQQGRRDLPPTPPASVASDVASRAEPVAEQNATPVTDVTPPAHIADAMKVQTVAEQATDNALSMVPQPQPAPDMQAPADSPDDVRSEVSAAPGREAAAILSDAVSEQVSRSFGELALALDSSPRRSFDEIAEDMLRPMLQEWLDDNLPTMVERLVREEIERVARGPRRQG